MTLVAKNTITNTFIQYLQQLIVGLAQPNTNIYIVAQPTGTVIPVSNIQAQNGTIILEFISKTTPNPLSQLQLFAGNILVAYYILTTQITNYNYPLYVQWTINFSVTETNLNLNQNILLQDLSQVFTDNFTPVSLVTSVTPVYKSITPGNIAYYINTTQGQVVSYYLNIGGNIIAQGVVTSNYGGVLDVSITFSFTQG